MIQQILCKIRLHKWKYVYKPKHITTNKFATDIITHTRRCTICSAIQYKEDVHTYTGYYEGAWTSV